jgi:hypothetical protein
MSAPAPALAKVHYVACKVRLGDAAALAGLLSLCFGVLVLLFPTWFPRVITESWQYGTLVPVLTFFSVAVNAAMYLRIAHKQFARPEPLASGFMALLTVGTVMGFGFLLESVALHPQLQPGSNTQARITEEVLALIYFALMGAILVPHFVIRFTQNLFQRSESESTDVHAAVR